MKLIIDNIALISIVISLLNIGIVIYKWYMGRPRLEFLPNDNMINVYKPSTPSEYNYSNSECIVFYYAKMFNNSSYPCTIGEFLLSVEGYEDTTYSKRVIIRDNYTLSSAKGIYGSNCIQMPLTIPAFGYCEGYLIFPFAPSYKENHICCEISTIGSRQKFTTYGFIDRQKSYM